MRGIIAGFKTNMEVDKDLILEDLTAFAQILDSGVL
jgi:hypothetical protein